MKPRHFSTSSISFSPRPWHRAWALVFLLAAMTSHAEESVDESGADTNNQSNAQESALNIVPFAGIGFGRLEFTTENFQGLNPKYKTITARVGARFGRYLATEFRLSRSLTNENQVIDKTKITTELDYMAGGYLKAGIGETLHPYALLGYNVLAISASGSNSAATQAIEDIDSDIAMGLGLELKISNYGNQIRLTLECSNYYDRNDTTLAGCQFGAFAQF